MSQPAPTPVDLISAAQVVEDQAQSLRDAMETAKHWLTANTQLDASMRFVRAYSILNQALEGRLGDLDQLSKDLRESAPPEPAGRPLQVILADIRAQGHENIHLRRHGATWWLSTTIKTEQRPNESNQDYLRRNEDKLSWSDADDPGPLAEARLAEIREAHAEKLAKDGIAADLPKHVIERAMAEVAAGREPYSGFNEAQARLYGVSPEEAQADSDAEASEPDEIPPVIARDGLPYRRFTEETELAAEDAARELAASEHIANITDAEDGVVDGEEG